MPIALQGLLVRLRRMIQVRRVWDVNSRSSFILSVYHRADELSGGGNHGHHHRDHTKHVALATCDRCSREIEF